MSAPTARPRPYDLLFTALQELLLALAGDGDEATALQRSFESTAGGFGARNALLLVVDSSDPLRLSLLHAVGSLSREQIAACERGQSVRGVSPSVIRAAIASGRAELVEDPRLTAPARSTASLEGDFSVICAPIRDLAAERCLAVIYLQNDGLGQAYDESDRQWLEAYAQATGRLFGFALAERRRRRELSAVLDARELPDDAPEIVGGSAATVELRRRLHEVFIPAFDAPHPDPVLVLGERGTGKDLVARYLHAWSARRRRPYVVANCAEISDELAAARFSGHRRGAFTGAVNDEPGFFRAAQGGVLLLDEVGDLSLRAQGALLRVLESHAVQPVGETREIEVDVAVVLATHRDLEGAVAAGTLRQDFYDRFRLHTLSIPPLRERPDDVPELLEHFRRAHEQRTRKRTLGFSAEALRLLWSQAWPGNVRELARTCSLLITHVRPLARLDRELIERCLPELLATAPSPRAAASSWDEGSFDAAVQAFKRELLLARIVRHEGNRKAARESLGLARSTFHRYLSDLEIGVADDPGSAEPEG